MLKPHNKQKEIIVSNARFKVIRAGRKAGKTAMEVESICYKAIVSAKKLNLTKVTFPTGRKIIYIAPTQNQARDIVWSAFRNRLHGLAKFNEQRLEIQLLNEDGETTTIMIGGWENRENYRGLTDVIHITCDETDTLKNFFVSWQEIFRPMFLDTGGTADFIGTPKKENPNLRRLEKIAETDSNYECFHFTSKDNPHLSPAEIDMIEQEYKDNRDAYRQEILAEHTENQGALFSMSALLDMGTNTIEKTSSKYLVVDIADDGTDKTVFSFWEGLEEYRRERFARLNTEGVVGKIREYAAQEKIPYSHIIVDAIGVGAGVASSSLLDGIIGYKSSYAAIKTDMDIVKLPNVSYLNNSFVPKVTDYKNLRSQCVFTLADLVNNHKLSTKIQGEGRDRIVEELSAYQDVSKGDGKRMATQKEDVKNAIGRSPDESDCFIMRMYFEVVKRVSPVQSEESAAAREYLIESFARNNRNFNVGSNSTK